MAVVVWWARWRCLRPASRASAVVLPFSFSNTRSTATKPSWMLDASDAADASTLRRSTATSGGSKCPPLDYSSKVNPLTSVDDRSNAAGDAAIGAASVWAAYERVLVLGARRTVWILDTAARRLLLMPSSACTEKPSSSHLPSKPLRVLFDRTHE